MPELVSAEQILLIELLAKILGEYRKHSEQKKEMQFNCPTCAQLKDVEYDHKYNLEVNYGMGVFNCWSCGKTYGTHGTIRNLIEKYGDSNDLMIYQSLGLQYEYVSNDETVVREDTTLKLPSEFVSLKGKRIMKVYKQAFTYLDSRGITDEIIEKYNIGWCYAGKYENRILVPSIVRVENDDGEEREWVNYFTTRSFVPYVIPKYMNCDKDKELMVFNESLVNWNKTIFLVEGPFDHIVTPNSLSMLGKNLYPLLKRTIYQKANNNVVILTDPDAKETGISIYRELDGGRLLGKVFINFLPSKIDPAKFFEKFGFEAYKTQLRKSIRLID